MAKITTKDKHFWKIVAFILVIVNIALFTILLGLIFEGKVYEKQFIEIEQSLYSKQIEETQFGLDSAPITMVMYSDFECPYCKKFHKKIFAKLKEEYIDTGKLRIVFIHYPKTKIHKSALLEAQAFECAKEQDKSYELYPYLYSEKRLNKAELLNIVQELGVDIPLFEECLYLERYKHDILMQKEEAEEKGIVMTPTVVIDEVTIEGVKPYFIYQQIIDEKLNVYG